MSQVHTRLYSRSRTVQTVVITGLCALACTSEAAFAEAADAPDAQTLEKAIAFTRHYEQHQPSLAVSNERRSPDAFVNAGRGNVPLYIPASYDGSSPTALIVLLHGYMNNGDEIEAYFQFAQFVDAYNFILVTPTGQSNFLGMEYWNATDACCDLFGGNPDDSGYLRTLVETVQAQYMIEPRRIHFAGHSNGGFMSYRMACDHADLVASIASLAGATWANPNNCSPSEPVHTLQIHGTSDGVISYNGGTVPLGAFQPGAVVTTQTWAGYDGCAPVSTPGPDTFDLTTNAAGDDASESAYITDCADGGSARLWTIPGGPHSPGLTQDFRTLVLDFLFAHPKVAPCPTDISGDGATDISDLLQLLAVFDTDSIDGDVTGDGQADISDLLALLAAFDTACP